MDCLPLFLLHRVVYSAAFSEVLCAAAAYILILCSPDRRLLSSLRTSREHIRPAGMTRWQEWLPSIQIPNILNLYDQFTVCDVFGRSLSQDEKNPDELRIPTRFVFMVEEEESVRAMMSDTFIPPAFDPLSVRG